jgi:hypothetical protein
MAGKRQTSFQFKASSSFAYLYQIETRDAGPARRPFIWSKVDFARTSAANERCRAEMLRWASKALNQGLFFRSLDISFGFAKPRD